MIFCDYRPAPPPKKKRRSFVCAGCDVLVLMPVKRGPTPHYCNSCMELSFLRQRKLQASIHTAIFEGRLQDPKELSCVDCEKPAYCYDHRDWDRPLEVEPVCSGCNTRRGPAKNLRKK